MIIRTFWLAKTKERRGKLFIFVPLLMSHVSCIQSCSYTADNTCLYLAVKLQSVKLLILLHINYQSEHQYDIIRFRENIFCELFYDDFSLLYPEFFSGPTFYQMMHQFRSLTTSPTNYKHKYSIVNRHFLYIILHFTYQHQSIISTHKETRYTKKRNFSLVRGLRHMFTQCVNIRKFVAMEIQNWVMTKRKLTVILLYYVYIEILIIIRTRWTLTYVHLRFTL
jgi:hypothetical protein